MGDFRKIRSSARYLRELTPRRLRRSFADKRGAVALIVALAAPVLIGFTALGTDVAYWYGSREALQAGLDAAAFSAAHFATIDAAPVVELVAVTAANEATNNQFNFTTQNLTATVAACYQTGKGQGSGETKCPGDSDYDASKAAANMTASSTAWVTVSANIPQPVFFIGALMKMQPTLALQAVSITQTNLTPPPNDTCVTSVGNTGAGPGGGFHEGGPSFGSCGNTSSQLTQIPMIPAYEGYLNQTAYYLNDNGGALPAATPSNLPNSAPNCNALYNPSNPTVNAGDPTSTSSNGTQVYFGQTTATSSGYSFSPTLVGPGSQFCDTNNVCTIPAGAYCGGLQVEPGVTVNFADNGGSSNFMMLDGNLVVPSIGVTYGPGNDSNATFMFGGSDVGWLMQNTQTAIYPGEIQNGTMTYTTTTTSVVQNTGSSMSEDQICPGGVVATGIGAGGVPTCPAITQTTDSEGQTDTNLSGSQTVTGETTQAYDYSVGSTPLEQVDTYVTKVTFQNGIPVYSQASETTTTSAYDSTTGQYDQVTSGGAIGLNVNGPIGGNSSATPDALSDNCQAQSKNNLFSSQTPVGQGYSFSGSAGQGYTQQVDTIEVCGTGPKLTADPTGAEILASGTMTNHIYLIQ